MNKITLTILPFLFTTITFYGQNATQLPDHSHEFDEKKAYEEAIQKGIPESDRKGYVERYLKPKFYRENGREYTYTSQDRTMRINLTPPAVHNANCPNAEFEMNDFSNWTSNTGTIANGGVASWSGPGTYGPTNSNPNTSWSADIMTTPPGNNNPGLGPVVGYDPIAINPISGLADIPLVSPNGGTSSVRLGNEQVGALTERLIYSMAVSPANAQFTYQYAVVLQDPNHPLGQQPFFKVTMKDASGNPLAGCGQYQIDATQAATDPTYINITYGFEPLYYKPWTIVSVDLSAYIGQTITIEFQTADCTQTGHFGYAYIDASCGIIQGYVNGYCTGSTQVLLTAPTGFTGYQWSGPNTFTPIPGATDDSVIVNNPNLNDTFYVQMVNAAGCTTVVMTIITPSTLDVQSITSSPTCPGGSSGSANVIPTGGLVSGYNFVWSTGPSGTGTVLGTTQSISGLPQDTAFVYITSGNCPPKDTFVIVNNAPVPPTTSTVVFCSNAVQLSAPSTGSNYQWYDPFNFAVTPNGNNDSLLVLSPTNGNIWSVGFNDTATGCRDSMRFTLSQSAFNVTGGANNACFGGSNGSISFNATSGFGPYSYNITGPASYSNTGTTGSTVYIINNLAPGTYTAVVNTPNCYDSLTVTVLQNPFSATNQTSSFCTSTITLTAPTGSGQTNYQWYDNTGAPVSGAPGTNDSLTVISPVSGNIYSVSFFNSNGCKDSIRITLSAIVLSTTPVSTNSCFGGNTGSLQATSTTSGLAPYQYSITGPVSQSNSSTATSFTFSSLPAGTYTLTVTSNNGNCIYDSVVTVAPNPVPVTSSTDSICPSDSTTFISSVTGPTHQWFDPSGNLIPGATTATLSASPASTGIYIDSVESAAGCVSVYQLTVDQIQFNAAVTLLVNNPCYLDSVGFISVGASGGNGPYIFNWSGPGGFSGTGISQSDLNSGAYQIIAKSGNCKDTVTVNITEPPMPEDTLVILTSFCDGDTSAILVAPLGYSDYQWYYNGGEISGATNDSIFILNPSATYTNYSVSYIIPPCERKSIVVYRSIPSALFTPGITTNIFTPNGDGKNDLFHPFFNPLVNQAYIDYVEDGYTIKVYDRWGLLVFESEDYAVQWNGKTKNGKEAPEGTYFWLSTYRSRCGTGEVTSNSGFVQLLR